MAEWDPFRLVPLCAADRRRHGANVGRDAADSGSFRDTLPTADEVHGGPTVTSAEDRARRSGPAEAFRLAERSWRELAAGLG